MLRTLLLILSLCISSTAVGAAPVSRDDPESSDPGGAAISTAVGSAVVVPANPRASQAALAVLNAGGSAVDALVTAQAVLAVVEPQSSGLAGGGFLLHWDASQHKLAVLDGREVAPERSRPGDLLDAAGDPLPWRQATSQANAIGIPGTVALLWEAHQNHGQLPWATTLQPVRQRGGRNCHQHPDHLDPADQDRSHRPPFRAVESQWTRPHRSHP